MNGNEKKAAFEKELRALMEKHNVFIDRETDYDGRDEACSVSWSFSSADWEGVELELRNLSKP